MRNMPTLFLTAALLAAVAVTPAMAQDHRDYGEWHGDIRHFHEYDYNHWREGRWINGFHEGRTGWWWVTGSDWYYYPSPVYPYPDPYTPSMVLEQVVPGAPVAVAPTYVYYCPNPVGYYPYVAQCFYPWRRVLSAASVAPPPQALQPQVIVQQPSVAQPAFVQPSVQPSAPVMQPPVGISSQRDQDDRSLNNLAVEYQYIDLTAPNAATKLRALEKKVEAFRQTLYTRSYGDMDILKDADSLEHRIAEQREKLSEYGGAPMNVVPMPREPVEAQPFEQSM